MKYKRYTVEGENINMQFDSYSLAVKTAKPISNGKTIYIREITKNEEDSETSKIVRIYRNGIQIKPIKEC